MVLTSVAVVYVVLAMLMLAVAESNRHASRPTHVIPGARLLLAAPQHVSVSLTVSSGAPAQILPSSFITRDRRTSLSLRCGVLR